MEVVTSRKEEIVRIAANQFGSKSYLATSVRDIAKGIGFKSSSLYNHFGSKDEILRDICFSVANEYISNFNEVNELSISCTEKIRLVIKKHVQMATTKTAFDTVTNNDWMHLKEVDLKVFLDLRKQYENKIMQLLEEGIASKEFAPSNTKLTMLTIVGSPRWLHSWYRPNRGVSIKEIENNTVNLLLRGLRL